MYSLPPSLPRWNTNRNAIQLEEHLNSLKDSEVAGEKHAAALASGKDENPESGLAELRARHQVMPWVPFIDGVVGAVSR